MLVLVVVVVVVGLGVLAMGGVNTPVHMFYGCTYLPPFRVYL